MRSTFKVLFYVKKGSEKPNGNLPLMCRLTVDGEVKQFSCKVCHLVIDGDASKDGRVAFGVWLALLHNKQNRKGTFIHRCKCLCYVCFVGLLHRVANKLNIMQHAVPKRFIIANITSLFGTRK